NRPEGRYYHTAVCSGNEMIVWGGFDGLGRLNTGGRYDPPTDSWIATNTTNAPTARLAHTAVWTDREMIVWGGDTLSGDLNTGGRYDPATNSWATTSTTNAPARPYHPTALCGSEIIVWGGIDGVRLLDIGGRR